MMRISLFALVWSFLLLAPALRAQDARGALDSWLDDNAGKMGGRVMLVISKDGKIVYSRSVNEMSRRQKVVNKYMARRMSRENDNEDYTMDTRQPVASCSKWFSAALIMTFVDDGSLSLSDTVGKYLPVLTLHGKGNITIAQCLSHLTGINEPPLKEGIKAIVRARDMDEAIANIAAMPMEGQPGKVFHYSNAGLQIAGAVIEKISGKSYEVLFAERITRPLGMRHTDFGMGPVALAAGGAGSTPADYMSFLEMIRNGGVYNGHRILSQQSVAEMQINRITPDIRISYSPASMQIGYGYGEWVLPGAVTSPGLFGSIPLVDNKKGYSAFLMSFYLKNEGREQRLKELWRLMDAVVQ